MRWAYHVPWLLPLPPAEGFVTRPHDAMAHVGRCVSAVFATNEAPDGLYIVLRGSVAVVKDTSIQSRRAAPARFKDLQRPPSATPEAAQRRANIDADVSRLSLAARQAAEGMGEVRAVAPPPPTATATATTAATQFN